jgi:NADP-dependent aldehyde dehydrogenase
MNKTLSSYSTIKGKFLEATYPLSSETEVAQAVEAATEAAIPYAKKTFIERAVFLEAIVAEIMQLGDALLQLTHEETALPDRQPLPRADLRRILQPIGPVLVFGASNFPYAYSTAGGDTASALAAGCPVIVKAHESHLGTNQMVAEAVLRAAEKTRMPKGVFASLIGTGSELGQQLAANESIQAIGFTGSYRAGMAIYRTATQKRKTPIPVYAEMSSINPVVLLPNRLAEQTVAIATALAVSITLGVGQFCTSPGLIFAINDEATQAFAAELATALSNASAATMLNPQICNTYYADKKQLAQTSHIKILMEGSDLSEIFQATPALMQTTGVHFMANPALQKEIFGPCSLLVVCKNQEELHAAIATMEGQLTGSIFGSTEELLEHQVLVDNLQQKVGRLIFNNVPTGVEVCNAIVHGGPFPATTDARTTSVGPEAIRRFARPICYQDCPQALLPLYLRNQNEAGVVRLVNGIYTKDAVE